MITENLSTLKIHKLTQAQYDRELEAGRIDENALYLTPDEEIDLSPYATIEQLNEKADAEHTHAIDDITNLKTTLDGKAANSHTHNVADISDLTATVTELNIMGGVTATTAEINHLDGVTSNIQTQLNNKVASSTLSNYYTKTEIDNLELITVDDIDTICGTIIQVVNSTSEVTF